MIFFRVKAVSEVLYQITQFPRLPCENLSILAATGRFLAENICLAEDLPPFARSTMDGYAVRAKDVFGARETEPVVLRLRGEIPMGVAPNFVLAPGETARIATGGMLPEGADAVVMMEYTEEIGNLVEIRKPVSPGEHVLSRGEDARAGELLLPRGTKLQASKIGLLASAGITEVKVHRRPNVAVISTGDELVSPTEPLAPGQVRDTNSYSLGAAVQEAGGNPILLGIVRDQKEELLRVLEQALAQADVVLISGGSSVGARDYTLQCFLQLPEVEVLCHGLAVRPGKPTILARVKNKVLFGLPGQMASALLIFYILVRPFLLHLQGARDSELELPKVRARANRNIPSTQGREDYIRVSLFTKGEELWAEPIFRRSGLISSMAKAQGLLRIPQKSEGLYEGEWAEVWLLP